MRTLRMRAYLLSPVDQKNKKEKIFEGSAWKILLAIFAFLIKNLWRSFLKGIQIHWQKISVNLESLEINYQNSVRLIIIFIVNVVVLVWQVYSNPYFVSRNLENNTENTKLINQENNLDKVLAPVRLNNSRVGVVKGTKENNSTIKKNEISNAIFPFKEELCQKNKESKISSNDCEEEKPQSTVKKTTAGKNVGQTNNKKVIKAKMPADYKRVGGLLVCAKKHDKPGKSKQNKGKHMDMECCLDPDEYPNPHCYYPEKKYGDLLSKYYEKSKKKK